MPQSLGGRVRGFLVSWLSKHSSGQKLEDFVRERPEQWLIWEAGPWRPTYQNKDTLEQSNEKLRAPHGADESLAIALDQNAKKPYVSLGRGPDNDVVIDDATLSRLHLLFQKAGETWTVRDAGSTNGTTVEGARLGPDPVELQPGMRILAGSVRLTFYDSGGLYLRLKGAR
jgi:pSer/pThr/pTyr-binding forkhead associated (FHA) protein